MTASSASSPSRGLSFAEYLNYDALGLAGLVRSGETSADELLDIALARIDAVNPAINAVVDIFADKARAQIAQGLPERYRNAGLVIFGKTHSCEFGGSPTTESQLYGVTRNPWNLKFSAGGSSGGSSAAIAAGILPAANGSDAGGSIRSPAATTRCARIPCTLR